VDWTLRVADETGQLFFDSELHRLRGEFLLVSGPQGNRAAQQCFRTALEIARRQSAKSWELRATMSLARLLTKQGRRDEARRTLSEIYDWFTEGFDTRDLKEAKALLDDLN
jgi:predicted ATPase